MENSPATSEPVVSTVVPPTAVTSEPEAEYETVLHQPPIVGPPPSYSEVPPKRNYWQVIAVILLGVVLVGGFILTKYLGQ